MSYDDIVELYLESKKLPFRVYIEQFSLFRMCGSLQDKAVLDLACGGGLYTREAIKKGAHQSVGVDISEKSIELAKANSQEIPNIQYVTHDARDLPKIGEFDFVLGAYLLNHAKSRDELKRYVQSIYNNLGPGGQFIGINDNPGNAPEYYKKYKKYGFLKEGPKQRKEGDSITYTFFNESGTSFSLDNYYLSLETYEEVFLEVGFSSFQWTTLKISEKSKEKYSLDYWRTFLNHPPIIGIEATY